MPNGVRDTPEVWVGVWGGGVVDSMQSHPLSIMSQIYHGSIRLSGLIFLCIEDKIEFQGVNNRH